MDGRPVAIFGSNGAGKTNILEAVSLFSPGRGLRRASAQDMARKPDALGWTLSGSILRDGHQREVKMQSREGAPRQLTLDGKSASQVTLANLCRVVWLVPSMDRLWIESAEGRRRFLDRMTMSFFPEHAEAALAYEKAMRERNRLLKDQVRDSHWYIALERQMADQGARINMARQEALYKLVSAQDTSKANFPTASLELVHPDDEMPTTAMDLAQAFSENRMRDMAAGRSLIGPHRTDMIGEYADKEVPAKDCSTGEQKALLISLILANVRALKSQIGFAPIILLDEVTAHLDPNRREALYDEICTLDTQAWMTGTEKDLFLPLAQRAQFIEVSADNKKSHVEMHKM